MHAVQKPPICIYAGQSAFNSIHQAVVTGYLLIWSTHIHVYSEKMKLQLIGQGNTLEYSFGGWLRAVYNLVIVSRVTGLFHADKFCRSSCMTCVPNFCAQLDSLPDL